MWAKRIEKIFMQLLGVILSIAFLFPIYVLAINSFKPLRDIYKNDNNKNQRLCLCAAQIIFSKCSTVNIHTYHLCRAIRSTVCYCHCNCIVDAVVLQ